MVHTRRLRSIPRREGAVLLTTAAMGSLLAVACGANETEHAPEITEAQAEEPLALKPSTELVCPPGSTLDTSGSKLCVDGDSAVGPFTWEMKQICRKADRGDACNMGYWGLAFARSIRGSGVCPPGATQSDRGICIEGRDAFGPFTREHVDACVKNGGGDVCTNSLQWNGAFADATAPAIPPNNALPWKWISGLDHGLRSDSCGAGDFLAPRGGGRRLHKGLDILLPVGANLYSPCAGNVETGFEGAGYGSYVVVTCRVPDRITGGNSTFVGLLYGHLSRLSVGNGATVRAGQKVGEVGKSGNATGNCVKPHVHFEAVVEATALRANMAMPRSMVESEARLSPSELSAFAMGGTENDSIGVFGNVGSLASGLASRCMNPVGFRTRKGLSYGNVIDPFVLLTCLAGNKPTLTRSNLQNAYLPWKSFYSASGFNVNIGIR